MNTIKSAAVVFICAIMFQLLTQLVFNNIASGQEYNPYASKSAPFIELPHHEAVRLPSELYYYWAKEHNRRQWARVKPRETVITRIDTIATSGSRLYGRGTTSTTVQQVNRPAANMPVIIYNPFFK